MPATRQKPSARAVKKPASKNASPATSPKTAQLSASVTVLVKSLVKEISKHGAGIKAAVTKTGSFPAQSRAAKKSQISSAIQARVLKRALGKSVSKEELHHHTSINAEILKRSVQSQIKHMGNHPISLVATTNVRHGLDLKSIQTKSFVVTHSNAKVNQKLLAKELKKVAKMKPSLVKSKLDLSAARIAVNTEVINFTQIVKRAVIADLKSTVKRVLPTKVAKRSKSPARPSSPSRASSPRK